MGQKPATPANDYARAVNAELRGLMAKRGLSQTKLADLTGIPQTTISKLLFVEASPLNVTRLAQICDVLRIDPSDVLESAERALIRGSYYLAAKGHEPDINEEDYL